MTVVTRSPGAVGSGPWTNFTPASLQSGDDNYASVSLNSANNVLEQTASAFGFAIPADATIASVTVEGRCGFADAITAPRHLYLEMHYGAPLFGFAQFDLAAGEGVGWTIIQAAADPSLPTVAQLNSPDFAVVTHAWRGSGGNALVTLDYITLTVEYDEYVPPEPPDVPTVATWGIGNITATTASGGGSVLSGEGLEIDARGLGWSTVPDPRSSGHVSGSGMGDFTQLMTGLTPGTTYYVVAFAHSSAGYGFGEVVTFVTLPVLPTVWTFDVTDIAATTATGGGSVTADGGADVEWCGLCWSTVPDPRGSDRGSCGEGMGDFTRDMPGLTPGTRYYVAAYAKNAVGYAYGEIKTFVTLPVVPTVGTWDVWAITPTTVSGGGIVASDGGSAITGRGVYVGLSPNPREAYSSTDAGMGEFWCDFAGLTPGTRYYVAAFARNSAGYGYGPDKTFVTHGHPTVATAGIYDITATTATGGGDVTSDGGEAVTARGVCWSPTNPYPTTANPHTAASGSTGVFASALTGLATGSTYNVRAYAANAVGTAYGAAVVFTAIADAPPVEPPPGPPRDPSRNLLFDGTLELMVGTLDVAGLGMTQVKYSNSNPGGFGNLSFRLPAAAPWGTFDAQVVKGAAVTMKHGLVGFAATLFEGEVTNDVSHAAIAGGKACYDVTCAGIWWKAGQRKDFSVVIGDDDYSQWYAMDDNANAFKVSTDGCLDIRLEAGQSAAAGDSASLYYWLGKGMGDPAASIDFLFGLMTLKTTGANWGAQVLSAPTPWGPWTECAIWSNGFIPTSIAACVSILGGNPQALQLRLSTSSAVDTLDSDRFIRLDKASVGSGVSANGLSAVSVANPTVVTAASAHGLKTGDRVFVTQTAESTPTIGGWRTVTVTNATHFTVPVAVTTAGGTGTFYKATRIDQALVEIAVTTGLATLASLQPGGIGNLNWGLNVRPHASRAGSIDLLSAVNVAPFDYGFWDNRTFYCQDRPLAIRALHDYLIDSSLPGIDFDVRRATEDSPTVVKVLYKFRAEDGVASPYPDGTALAVYRSAIAHAPTYTANIIPVMTSNTAPSGVASASGVIDTRWAAWMAFDHVNTSGGIGGCWVNYGAANYLIYRFPAARVVTQYAITSRNSVDPGAPKAWTFQGSNDGSTWVTIDTRTNITDWEAAYNTRHVYPVANATAYAYYAVVTTQSNNGSYVGIGELEMMEAVSWVPEWSDASPVLDVWNEWADLSLTTAQAGDLGDQILAWLSANAYQGGGSIAPATVPLRAEGTKPTAYIRGGDYIEDANLDTGPLMITGFSMDADRGVATIGIGENRRAFVERLTPDKA